MTKRTVCKRLGHLWEMRGRQWFIWRRKKCWAFPHSDGSKMVGQGSRRRELSGCHDLQGYSSLSIKITMPNIFYWVYQLVSDKWNQRYTIIFLQMLRVALSCKEPHPNSKMSKMQTGVSGIGWQRLICHLQNKTTGIGYDK